MPKKSSNVSRKAWRLLQLTLLWARKGGLFRRRLMVDLQVMHKFLKNIACVSNPRKDQIGYVGELELSFDKTPVVCVKMHRPGSMRFLMPYIPCINPQIDFDYDFDGDGVDGSYDSERKSFIEDGRLEYEQSNEAEEGEGIDLRAEEFIAKFYEQLKLQ
ncbi:uncharacterized protein LOC116212208 [Punica granatum]|uniref:Uncharacterized protein n=2 Tax=Punica granatum TaxID=22663 RepID=A0A2I0J2X8_PUNGR|nr:uncharacterized protein LOC116212208 [Punica granatum]PKI50587.1 hypothetical protein CRG98_029027 [Punica granatum]